jgi:hypothetical protein
MAEAGGLMMTSSQRKLLALRLAALPEQDRQAVMSALTASEQIALNALVTKASRLAVVAYPELIQQLCDSANETETREPDQATLAHIKSAPKVWQRFAAKTLSPFEQELIDIHVSENLPPMLCAAVASALTETHHGKDVS